MISARSIGFDRIASSPDAAIGSSRDARATTDLGAVGHGRVFRSQVRFATPFANAHVCNSGVTPAARLAGSAASTFMNTVHRRFRQTHSSS